MRPRDTIALILIAIALTFAALAIGSAPRWAACGSAMLCLATAVPYVTSRRTASRPSPLLYPLAVAAGLTALQLLPLPRAIAEQLVPAKLALVTENATAWGDPPPTWVMASYDPPATLVELAKLCGYLALAWTCVRLAANRRARRWLAATVAGVATLVAVVTLAHHAAGATRLYGFIDPKFTPQLLGPLINVNHLAGYLGMTVPIALALAMAARGAWRATWLAATVGLTATTLLTASRGGMFSLAAGLVVIVAILVVQRRIGSADSGRRTPPSVAIPAGVVAACAVLLLGLLTAGDVARELEATTLDELSDPFSKYQVWVASGDLVADNHWLGVGKGGFEAAFTPLGPGLRTYSHAENSYLQAVLDFGLPGAAALALALLAAGRSAARRWRNGPLDGAALAALAALMNHDLADFALDLPAVILHAIAIAALLLPERLGTALEGSGARPSAAAPRLIATRAAALAVGAAVVLLAMTSLGAPARDDAADVAATSEPRQRLPQAQAAWARHPADALLAGRTAEALFALQDPRAVAVVNRALSRSPRHSGLHHLAARMLARSQRPAQSASSFAEAVRWATDIGPIVDDVRATFPAPADTAAALPADPRQMWRVLAALDRTTAAALAYARRVAEAFPRDATVQAQLADVALAHRDGDTAHAAALVAWEVDPTARHATLLGRALAARGDLDGARALLQTAVDSTRAASREDRVLLLFALGDVQVALGDPAAAKQTIERASSAAKGHRHLTIHGHLRAAAIEELLGNPNQADWERKQAQALELH